MNNYEVRSLCEQKKWDRFKHYHRLQKAWNKKIHTTDRKYLNEKSFAELYINAQAQAQQPVLRIRDVYHGFVSDFSIPDPGSRVDKIPDPDRHLRI
jgi:hypothetical protein